MGHFKVPLILNKVPLNIFGVFWNVSPLLMPLILWYYFEVIRFYLEALRKVPQIHISNVSLLYYN
jgi:hypothetical protein